MDERKIITGLAEIRKLAAESPLAVETIDELMQEMLFGDWPGDKPPIPPPAPEPPRKMEFFL